MKYTTPKTLATLGLFVVLAIASVATAQAQTSGKMKVNIPFDFSAGSARLSAGEYTVERYSGRILALRAVNNSKDVFVFSPFTVERTRNDWAGKLVFHRYGNEYFLAATWRTGDSIGNGLNESSAERSVAHQLARTNTRAETVVILASLR